MNVFNAVKEFHEKYRCDVDQTITSEKLKFREGLIDEEYDEMLNEIWNPSIGPKYGFKEGKDVDRSKLTKELADIIYVTVGMAVNFGLPLEEVFKRVHESNMTKTLDNKREDGKVLKGDDYKPPYLDDLFYEKFYDIMPSECEIGTS